MNAQEAKELTLKAVADDGEFDHHYKQIIKKITTAAKSKKSSIIYQTPFQHHTELCRKLRGNGYDVGTYPHGTQISWR